jgi:alpha-L-rhamnosidase
MARTTRRLVTVSLLLLAFVPVAFGASLQVRDLRCEYLENPLGIDTTTPRLSWKLRTEQRDVKQSAYHLLVASSKEKLENQTGDLWDTGKVDSDQSLNIMYDGRPLESQMHCFWKVRVWDNRGNASSWSEPARWSMGLLKPTDWKAHWIGLDEPADLPEHDQDWLKAKYIWHAEGEDAQAIPPGKRFFRRTFEVPKDRKITNANCLVFADDHFVLRANEIMVGMGSEAFNLDLTGFINNGTNVLAVEATNHGEDKNPAGLVLVLRVTFDKGDPMFIVSDEKWKSFTARQPDWEKAGFDDAAWQSTRMLGDYGMQPWGELEAKNEYRVLPARMLRGEFPAGKSIKRATAYIAGLGLYELYLNGQKVSDEVLVPAVTEYNERVLYRTYDVTDYLNADKNAVGVWLGSGRYFAPRINVPFKTETYGYPKMIFQMHIEFDDGSTADIVSNDHWKITTRGPLRNNNEYDGEYYDARWEQRGWAQTDFNDSNWRHAEPVDPPKGKLCAQMNEPIRVTETIKPLSVNEPEPGGYVFDMGQNMVGWCRLRVRAPEGTRITLRHAETIKEDGTLYLANLRSAKALNTYICKGKTIEHWEPRFVFHGFRYVAVRGYPGKPRLDAIRGRVVHDDVKQTGNFECSNDLINQIYKNTVWGVRGNYRSMPTDCPQRDERHGWLGDRSCESRGESYMFGINRLYHKWVTDMNDAQTDEGSVPDVAPPYWRMYTNDVTWPSSFIVIPGMLYDQYGDMRTLEKNYPAMKKWINFMTGFMSEGIMPQDTYGDWCVPPEEPELIHSQDPSRKTAGPILGTTYFYHDLELMARYAELLNKPGDAEKFNRMAEDLKDAFNEKYFDAEKGIYDNGSQTSSILPLAFDMVPRQHEEKVFNNLTSKIIEESNGHIGTGLIGAQWLNRVLTRNGRPDISYTIANQDTYPSWGYMIRQGATTIWELWNGDTANPAMNSRNHVMLIGDLVIWFYEHLAGIAPAEPGFKKIRMKPQVLDSLDYVNAWHESPYGKIASNWKKTGDGNFEWNIDVPANSSAIVYVPTMDADTITEKGRAVVDTPGIKFLRTEKNRAVFEIGSGRYQFTSRLPK